MITLAIGLVVAGGVATVIGNLAQTQTDGATLGHVASLREDLLRTANSEMSWPVTINKGSAGGSNPLSKMDCLGNGNPCTTDGTPNGPPIVDQVFALFNSDGRLIFDATNLSNGMDIRGQPCNSFSMAGNDSCPFRFDLKWSANCTVGNCVFPQIKMKATLYFKPLSTAMPLNTSRLSIMDLYVIRPLSPPPVPPLLPVCVPGKATFAGAGVTAFTVPAGCTTITVKAWGAGGGGGASIDGVLIGGYGGGGGFAQASINTVGGTVFNIFVGDGGPGGTTPPPTDVCSGGGGGYTAVIQAGVYQVIAAGGGGGGGAIGDPGGGGGGGGGLDGEFGGTTTDTVMGPSVVIGGAPGTSAGAGAGSPGRGGVWTGTNGLVLLGGNGFSPACTVPGGVPGGGIGAWGGGGGGGLYGGGGGGGNLGDTGGGGGAGYVIGPPSLLIAATLNAPGNIADADYLAPHAKGGIPGPLTGSPNGAAGGVGLVVISW
ncbi:MAG: hypothetical protein ACXVA9_01480 [Bdellovibrionales bacterium]